MLTALSALILETISIFILARIYSYPSLGVIEFVSIDRYPVIRLERPVVVNGTTSAIFAGLVLVA
ncbi:hypothetical protein D3C73_1662010 [compost metagenome]